MARKKERTFAIPVWHRKEQRLIPAGEPVNLEHLSNDEYTALTTAYPEDMPEGEQREQARRAAETNANREALREG